MKSIAFTFTSSDIDYAVLTGTKAQPTLHLKGKLVLPANHDIPQTVQWFETELDLLLNNVSAR